MPIALREKKVAIHSIRFHSQFEYQTKISIKDFLIEYKEILSSTRKYE